MTKTETLVAEVEDLEKQVDELLDERRTQDKALDRYTNTIDRLRFLAEQLDAAQSFGHEDRIADLTDQIVNAIYAA